MCILWLLIVQAKVKDVSFSMRTVLRKAVAASAGVQLNHVQLDSVQHTAALGLPGKDANSRDCKCARGLPNAGKWFAH